VDAFLADRSPDGYENLVDRLLASPRYGERMAVQWLDFARYADSNGFQEDGSRTMRRWRDWLIGALNANLPFDQFTIKQLAGDMLPGAALEDRIATGFNRNHRTNNEGGAIQEEWRVETVIDRVETTSQVWMGLTMGCARCHDHKYDPIAQKDFYRFFAFFNNVPETGYGAGSGANTPPLMLAPTPEQQARLQELQQAISAAEEALHRVEKTDLADAQAEWEDAVLLSGVTETARQSMPPKPAKGKKAKSAPKPGVAKPGVVAAKPGAAAVKPEPVPPAILAILKVDQDKRTPAQVKQVFDYCRPRLGGAIAEADKWLLEARKAKAAFEATVPQTMVMEEMPKPRDAFLLIRGQYDNHGEKVTAGLPAFLPPLPPGAAVNRLGLAQWLVSPEHPLTARVWVNRAWENFFGMGLVRLTSLSLSMIHVGIAHCGQIELGSSSQANVDQPGNLGQWRILAKDKDPANRREAATALEDFGPAAVGTLTELLQDKDQAVRWLAASVLGSIGPPAASSAPALADLLRDNQRSVRLAAVSSLEKMGQGAKPAIAKLAELLKDVDPHIREAASLALGKIGPAAIPALTTFFNEKQNRDWSPAINALAQIGPATIPALLELFREDDWGWCGAASALGRMRPAPIPLLIKLGKDKDWRLRRAAAIALGEIDSDPETVTTALAELAKDKSSGGQDCKMPSAR
jgi:HEAT repeat protein